MTTPVLQQTIRYRDDMVRCFVDTEFYEDGSTIDLISLGAVRSDGGEFYAVSSDAKLDRVSDWVRQNVVSQLPRKGDPRWQTRAQIAEGFSQFMSGTSLGGGMTTVGEMWSYYGAYDHVAICQLYGTMMGLPDHIPKYSMDLKQLSRMLGNPKHPEQKAGEHNALEDARWNRDLFAFLRTVPNGTFGWGR